MVLGELGLVGGATPPPNYMLYLICIATRSTTEMEY